MEHLNPKVHEPDHDFPTILLKLIQAEIQKQIADLTTDRDDIADVVREVINHELSITVDIDRL